MTVPVIFRFYRLRGGRTKGLKRRPFVNFRLGKSFGGLGLKASDRQRFSRGRPLGRDKVHPKLLKSYILSSLT